MILNVIDMLPNKRGPVELQAIATARACTAAGLPFAAAFGGPVPDWYREELETAGGRALSFERTRWTEEVVALCRREQPRLVHFHFGPHAGMTEVSALGPKVVRTEHSPRSPRRYELARIPVRHWHTRKVDLWIAVSEFIARQTAHDYAVPRRRIRVVLNATDTTRFRPRPGEKAELRRELLGLGEEHIVITLAANMRPAKRQEMAVLALPEVLAQAPQARLVLAGDGPDRPRLTQLVRDRALGEEVRILSGDNDVALIYAASDIALLPSVSEGLPGGGIEAIASGLPLVATPNGGTPEVYEDGVSGISVRDQTSHGLAAALLRLIGDPAGLERMGRRARERAERVFAIDRPAAETLAAYREILGP